MPLKDELSLFSRNLTVLLVEDDAVSRRQLGAQIRGVFKDVLLAGDGREGLELFRTRRPDLVLTDNVMPALSGIEMTEAIRGTDPKVPIIFITASMDIGLLVRAINLGIASIIPKPVVRDNLRQALALVVGMLENDHLQRVTAAQELALLQLRERYHEHQQELAFRKELSILENDCQVRTFGAPGTTRGEWLAQVQYAPHDIMCGDSYSLRRLADGSLLLFLADAMGKGLAASLTTSLSAYTFNLQVDALEGPFQFEAFVQRYTALMARRLLEDEVLSLTLAWLPAEGAVLHTAAFGMPPLLVGTAGEVHKLRCDNPPISAYQGAFRTAAHDLGAAGSLLFYTDGLNEAVTAEGGLYREHLDAEFAASAGLAQLWEAFRKRVAVPDDDVTFMLLSRVDAPAIWRDRLEVPSRLDPVEEACQVLEERLGALQGLEPDALYEFCAALREAMLNAYEHGSLEITSECKRRLLEEGTYYQHLQEKEQVLDRRITVDLEVQALGANRLLKVAIQDAGPGFTPPKVWVNDPDSLQLSGRGLKMVRKYTDGFIFNERGNRISLLRIFRGDSDAH